MTQRGIHQGSRLAHWIQEQIGHVPILIRLLIANGLVIVAGATIGTMLTKELVELSAFELMALFTVAGATLSLAINYLVLRVTLQPLSSLTSTVDRVQDGHTSIRAPFSAYQDPDIARLTEALNTMLDRLAAHTATIEANRQQLRALSAQVISAQEEERNRIARELHDETSQSLASLLIALERMDTVIPSELAELKKRLASARELTGETLKGLRALISDLRPLLLDDLGLMPAIRWSARERLESEGIDIECHIPARIPRLPPMAETALFRITQEAITNIIKHADAGQVHIDVCMNDKLTLTIRDDGVGFNASDPPPLGVRDHLGLFGIRERATALGGEAEIVSTPGAGTTVRVTVPLKRDEAP